MRPAHPLVFLVPYLGLGTPVLAKLILATISVPKFNLGTIDNGKCPGNFLLPFGCSHTGLGQETAQVPDDGAPG